MEIQKPNLSYERWRDKIIRIFYVIILLIFTVEFVMLIALKPLGLLEDGFSSSQYIVKFIAVPTILNVFVVTACYQINQQSIKERIKNYSISFTASLLASVVAFVHGDINAILTVFSLPVILTVLFGERRMMNAVTLFNGLLLLFSSIHTLIYNKAYTSVYFYLDVVVSLTILIASYLICSVLIAYNRANYDYIYKSYQTQVSLHEQARNDSLTGLYNQRTFHTLLKTSIDNAKSSRAPISLAIIDLDDFKEINDTYGHLAGDHVLLQFTDLMKQQCEEDAYISRYGGDEFAVIFPKASKELAYLRLESLRKRCRQMSSSQTSPCEISFSAGIAHFTEGDMNATLLFDHADTALYHAKENGKGQTALYPY